MAAKDLTEENMMDPIKSGSTTPYATQTVKSKTPPPVTQGQEQKQPLIKVEQNKVTLSAEGKALLATLKEIEQQDKTEENQEKTVGDKVESFTYGALGMERPDTQKEDEDSSYSAGRYLSTAASIGTLLLALA
jgi:hypothetical protein